MSAKVRTQVELELQQISRLQIQYAAMLRESDADEIPHETIVLLATVLHSFYNGAENAIKRILTTTDESIGSGESSHVGLLRQAASEASCRPPVISAQMFEDLRAYMAFRHFFRHSYSFQLDWIPMQTLVQGFAATADRFAEELYGFLDWLDESGFNTDGF